jgi:hypothetical protein
VSVLEIARFVGPFNSIFAAEKLSALLELSESQVSRWERKDRDELMHTVRYQRLGRHYTFLRYPVDRLTMGYANSPMELEVSAAAARICSE